MGEQDQGRPLRSLAWTEQSIVLEVYSLDEPRDELFVVLRNLIDALGQQVVHRRQPGLDSEKIGRAEDVILARSQVCANGILAHLIQIPTSLHREPVSLMVVQA